MNKTVRTLSIISLCFCGVYLLLFFLAIALQKMYLPREIKEKFFIPSTSISFSLLFVTIIIITNVLLLVKPFNRNHYVVPLVLSGVACAIHPLCVRFSWALDVNFIAILQGVEEVAGVSMVNSYLDAFTSFPLTVMSVLAIVSAAINCYHCKTFKEELH